MTPRNAPLPNGAADLLQLHTGREVAAPDSADEPLEDLDDTNSWAPIDLGPYVRGEVERAVPTVGLTRTDGVRMLYPGKEHWINGEMEAGKSWFCLACAAAELVAGERVVYVHFEEDDPSDTVDRLLALGVPAHLIVSGLAFAAPARRATPELLAQLLDPPPSLVILDGVNEGMSLHDQKIREEDGSAAWRRRVVKPCMRVGAAVLQADHVVKDPERRGRYGLGTIHKANGANGVVLLLENAEPFGRTLRGRSHVFVTKDRPGQLRRHGRPDRHVTGKTYVGELVVDDSQMFEPDLTLKVFAPAATTPQDGDESESGSGLGDRILEVLAGQPDAQIGSQRKLLAAMRNAGHKYRSKTSRTLSRSSSSPARSRRPGGGTTRRRTGRRVLPSRRPRVLPSECFRVRFPYRGEAGRTRGRCFPEALGSTRSTAVSSAPRGLRMRRPDRAEDGAALRTELVPLPLGLVATLVLRPADQPRPPRPTMPPPTEGERRERDRARRRRAAARGRARSAPS